MSTTTNATSTATTAAMTTALRTPTRIAVDASRLPAPCIQYDTAACEWVLADAYAVHDDRRGRILDIPAGFRFDLASIPRVAWWLIAPFELSIVAALAHDHLYRTGGADAGIIPPGSTYSRAQADRLFADLMRSEGVSAWRRRAAHAAVRAFGGGAWRSAGARVTAALAGRVA